MAENIRKGKLIQKGGKYSVVEAGRGKAIPIELTAGQAELEKLVGTEVEILYSTPKPVVIGLLPKIPPDFPHWCYFILCYYPPEPWWRTKFGDMTPVINETWRVEIADRLLKEGAIDREIHAKLTQY